jgi:hypothetical protein
MNLRVLASQTNGELSRHRKLCYKPQRIKEESYKQLQVLTIDRCAVLKRERWTFS